MPAILRIFLYQTGASQHDIRPYATIDVVQGQGGDLGQHEDLEQYEVGALDVQAYPGRQEHNDQPHYDGSHRRYLFLMYWA